MAAAACVICQTLLLATGLFDSRFKGMPAAFLSITFVFPFAIQEYADENQQKFNFTPPCTPDTQVINEH
jgi:hypothetical protein